MTSEEAHTNRLDGAHAVVTGGTDGIGFHVAMGLAARGAEITVTGRDALRGTRAVGEIRRQARTERVAFVQVDHLSVAANQRFVAQLAESVEALDILVNNVGRVFATRQETDDGYEASLALCLVGPAALTEAALPLLTRRPGARIVNMSSSAYKMWHHDLFEDIHSERNYVGIQAHAHAKVLNLVWTFALAERLRAHQVAVNATNPGAAWTPGTAQLTPDAVPAWRYVWPLVRFFQRRGSPTKAAEAPLWVLDASASMGLTGAYVEKHKVKHPDVAVSAENQRMVLDLVADLVTRAPPLERQRSAQPVLGVHHPNETPGGQGK